MKQIAETATVGAGTTLGTFTVIGERVSIGSGCIIGNNVVIHADTAIGNRVRIDDNTVIGKLPMKAVTSAVTKHAELPPATIADDVIVGTSAVVYRGCRVGRKVLIADMATVRENVTVGDCTIVGRGVAIENQCSIGRYCKLETNAYITAYSTIEDRCFIAPCVATSNDNYLGRSQKRFEAFGGITVKRGGRIGLNATILPGKVVAEDSVVAAGAVLTRDTEPQKIFTGIPAKYFRDVPHDERVETQGWEE